MKYSLLPIIFPMEVLDAPITAGELATQRSIQLVRLVLLGAFEDCPKIARGQQGSENNQ